MSAVVTGCRISSGAGIGTTTTSPSADCRPLEMRYEMRTCCSRVPWSVMRSVSWFSTETETPVPGSIDTDCTTRMPPAGSASLLSTPISTSPPVGSRATSRTATGGRSTSAASVTSMRTSPSPFSGPAVARYCT